MNLETIPSKRIVFFHPASYIFICIQKTGNKEAGVGTKGIHEGFCPHVVMQQKPSSVSAAEHTIIHLFGKPYVWTEYVYINMEGPMYPWGALSPENMRNL